MEIQLLLILFISSSIGATIVNKYVLSILKFTYPTVYQSWQMSVIFMSVCSLSCSGFIRLSNIERLAVKQWLPAMCFFTIAIYSGSIALSRLPIPIFATSFHFVYVSCSVADNFFFKKVLGLPSLFGLALGLVGLFFSISIYPLPLTAFCPLLILLGKCSVHETLERGVYFDFLGHRWMFVHCISSASYMTFSKGLYKGHLKDLEKILLNSSFSTFALLLIGFVTGELSRSLDFPQLFSKNFQYGCATSAITGSLLGLSYSRLTVLLSISRLRWISSIAMATTSVISSFVFPFKASILVVASIVATLTGSVVYTYHVSVEEHQDELEIEDKVEDLGVSEP